MIIAALVRKIAINCTQTDAKAKRSGVSILRVFLRKSLNLSNLAKVKSGFALNIISVCHFTSIISKPVYGNKVSFPKEKEEHVKNSSIAHNLQYFQFQWWPLNPNKNAIPTKTKKTITLIAFKK